MTPPVIEKRVCTDNQVSAVTVHATDAAAMSPLTYSDPLAILGTAPYPDAPWWRRLSPSTIFVLLASAIAIFFLLHELTIAGKLGYPSDESWIDQVYAHNFFHHVAFEFNPGERTAGPTSPFWVVFLSIGAGLFHDPIIAGKLLGSIFLFLTGYYGFRLLRTVGNDYGSSLLGGVLIVTGSQLAWSELSGLESTLSAALVVGALWWHFVNPHDWRHAIVGAIFALATLTRPETALLFLLLLVHSFVEHRSERKRGMEEREYWKELGLMVLAFIVVIAPIVITNLTVSGAVVPETYYAGLGNRSAIRLIRHGDIAIFLERVIVSLRSIWFTTAKVYLVENPLWIVTIAAALFVRQRNKLVERDRSDSLFSLTLLILLIFPYLRAVAIGTDDNFGEYGRWMHFLLPVYALAGLLSLRILVRHQMYRSFTPRQGILASVGALVVASVIYLALRPQTAISFTVISPPIDYILLVFFAGLLTSVGLRHAGISLFKRELPHSVTEEERGRMSFEPHDGDEESKLSEPMVRVLRATLLIMLAWNLTELPRAANDFADSVREMNNEHLALARVIANVTAPTDVIATNSIGAIGWLADRRVIDLSGHLTKEPNYNARTLGQELGMLKTLSEEHPQYLAMFGNEDSSAIARGIASGYLRLVRPNLYCLENSQLP